MNNLYECQKRKEGPAHRNRDVCKGEGHNIILKTGNEFINETDLINNNNNE